MMTDKLLIDRELLEQICVELEHVNDRYMLGRELRKALALPAAPADGEAVEEAKVVSYLSACTDGYDPDAPHPGPPEPLMTVAQHKRIVAQRDAENARLRAELEQSRDLIVEMSTHCNATALVADWLERNA